MSKYFVVAFIVVILTACSPNTSTSTISTPITTNDMASTVVPTSESIEATAEMPTNESTVATAEQPPATPTVEAVAMQSVERPALQTLPLINAHTNESFTLADFAGKTVLVEPMATWCTNCRQQLRNVESVREQLNDGNYVFVAISVAENIQNADLVTYAASTGYDLVYAIATPEMLTELANTFGRTSLNPPSTPHFIISPDGSMTALFTGSKSADDLKLLLTTASGA